MYVTNRIQHWVREADRNAIYMALLPLAGIFLLPTSAPYAINSHTIADGVALAAIQGLNQKLEQKETEITELRKELQEIKQLLSNLITKGNNQ